MTKRRFELVDDSSSKFWEITITGNEVRTTYGRIGTAGQTSVKDEGSGEAATKLYAKLVKEKTKKGYVEIGGAPAATSTFDVFARLEALASVDAVDEDGDEVLGLAGIEAHTSDAARQGALAAGLIPSNAPAGSITPLMQERSGSQIVGWKPNAETPMRAVWIDSEGEPRAVFAASMEELIALAPHGLGYLHECIRKAERGEAHAKSSGCDVDAWTDAGFPPHPSPGKAVLAAHRGGPSFEDWLASLGE